MKMLVTGSSGFLGFHTSRALLKQGHTVIGIDNYSGSDSDNHVDLKREYPKTFLYLNRDCSDLESMQDEMRSNLPDVVYHMACFPHEGLSVCSPATVVQSVTMGTMATLSAAVESGVKRFIYTSSMARYGAQDTVPFTEDMIPCPQDPYGWAKYAAEGQVRSVCEAYGMEYVIAVPHNIYGTHQRYVDPFRNVAAIMCNRVLMGRQPIIYGDGMQRRCFSFVDDLTDSFVRMATDVRVVGEVINIGPEDPFITINELSRIVCEIGGLPYNPIYAPDRPREVKHANCSSKKAKEMLGVNFKTPLYEGIKTLFQWIKDEGAREFEYHLPIEITHEKTPITWRDKLHSK